jgi:hypothetical protein
LQVEEAPKKSQRAKILKLADKISNVTAIGRDPPDERLERTVTKRDAADPRNGLDKVLAAARAAARSRERIQVVSRGVVPYTRAYFAARHLEP